MLDLIVRNGEVIDGCGQVLPGADVGIRAGTIVALGQRLSEPSRRAVEATGMVVCPGFVDIHSHGDLEALRQPASDAKIVQGVTTELIGSCGFSLYPVSSRYRQEAFDFVSQLLDGVEPDHLFADAAAYRGAVGSTSTNLVSQVGHNLLRIAVNGCREVLPPEALRQAAALLRAQFSAGACGLSTGLLYTPACFADTAELAFLAKEVAAAGRLFTCHIRDEGDGLCDSIAEMLAVLEQSKVSMEISHLKVSGRRNWGRMGAILQTLSDAAAKGYDLSFDSYPYVFGCSTIMTLLPKEALAAGPEQLAAHLADAAVRDSLRLRMLAPASLLTSVGAEQILVASCSDPQYRGYAGQSLASIAAARQTEVVDLIFDLVVRERGRTSIFLFQMDERDVRLALSHPLGCLGSDGIPVRQGMAHPRLHSAFLQMLRHYVLDEHLGSLPQAVQRLSVRPARKLRLARRGQLAVGNRADVVVFDPGRIRPAGMPGSGVERRGMDWVILNGQIVVEDAEYNGVRAGVVLGA